MKKILILGAGWLGKPLALQLAQQGHSVCITGREYGALQFATKLLNYQLNPATSRSLIQNETFNLTNKMSREKLHHILVKHSIDTIIGSFPPGFRQGKGHEYADHWSMIVQVAQQFNQEQVNPITKILMTSATSVYPDIATLMTEDVATLKLVNQPNASVPFSNKAQVMLTAEQHLIDSNIPYAILRLSGLFGPERHPARFIPHMKTISQKAPANMLHQQDAIHASIFALDNIENMVVNVTIPQRLSKADFYQAALNQSLSTKQPSDITSNIQLPNKSQDDGKQISAEKIINLGYQFKFDSFFDALNSNNITSE